MKKIAEILFVFSIFCAASSAQENLLTVIPQPKEYKFTNQRFSLNHTLLIFKFFCKEYTTLNNAVNELKEELSEYKKIKLIRSKNSSADILIGIPADNLEFQKYLKKNKIYLHKELGEEGYTLLINSHQIIIAANNQKGIFYGIQTLIQIIRGSSNKNYLQGIRIVDYPTLKYRAVMDDISRGPVPTMDFLKYQVRRYAEMKINMMMQYVENTVKTKNHPEFAPEDGSLTIEEWKELSDYARQYNVTVVGGFQSFGHFNNILKIPEYSHLGENGTLLSPMFVESYKFLDDIYSEMIPAFQAPFFNVNCDETFDLGKGASKKLVDSLGYAEVYYRHIIKLYKLVKKHHVRMIMWGDILLKYPELLKKLPKDIIIGTWTYDALNSYKDFIEPFKKAGFDFFVTPGVLNSNKIFPNYFQTFGNIKGFAIDAESYGALGLINTVWNDGGNAFFSNDWYGLAYSADKSWNPRSNDSTNFDARINRGIYGSKNNNFTKAIREIEKLRMLEPTDGMNDKVLFPELLPDSGKSGRISLIDWKKVLTISEKADSILDGVELKNYSADKKYLKFVVQLYKSLANERLKLFKCSLLYSKADSLFQTDPVLSRKLIVKSVKLITGIINSFSRIRNEFENLWLGENRTYAMNVITNKYDAKINDYLDVKSRLLQSLKRLDSRKSILKIEDVRLLISKLPGKYFREWLIVNPLPNSDKLRNSQIDYLADMGGEMNVVPQVTQEFYYDSVKYRWRRFVTKYEDVVDFHELFPDKDSEKVMYAFANIDVDKDTTVTAAVSFVDGLTVYLNSNKIFQRSGSGRLLIKELKFNLPLKKGRNNLMLKISQTTGNWGFTFRLPGSEVRNNKNRYRIIDLKNYSR